MNNTFKSMHGKKGAASLLDQVKKGLGFSLFLLILYSKLKQGPRLFTSIKVENPNRGLEIVRYKNSSLTCMIMFLTSFFVRILC